MASKVYLTDLRTKDQGGLLIKMDRLIRAAGIEDIDMEKKFVAIKLHFGEYGNLAYPKPQYVKVISDIVKEKGGIPFMVDCNTLYVGMRKNGVEHLQCAELNGFNSVTTGCQTIIGDGLKGSDDVEIPIEKGVYCKTAKIGRAVADADIIITLNHFKGHEITGIGGAMKNLGMGCASRRGKMELHTSGKPVLDAEKCRGCGKCKPVCAQDALNMEGKKMVLDNNKCVGCGRCIAICPFDAITAMYDEKMDIVNCKIVEYTKAVIDGKPNFHITLLTDVSPLCDCHDHNDMPIIPNVGILASYDPVALDMACVDLAQQQPMIPGSILFTECEGKKPEDIFAVTNKGTHWQSHFTHAKEIGLGDGIYELEKI
jgi:hypothetical protein